MNTELYPHQLDAARRMHNGCVLNGKVGCGKSRTALAYVYVCELGGSLKINGKGSYKRPTDHRDIYIITTAKKRDTHEWEQECAYFALERTNKVKVDSWNNVQKYTKVVGAVFIFDEQKTTSGKKWAKAFMKIARRNHWIMLSATPGDKYVEFWPILVASGFYSSKSQFEAEHCIFKPFLKYKDIDHYVNTKRLDYYISKVMVTIDYKNKAQKHVIDIICDYDKDMYKRVMKNRWDVYDDCPITETGKLCYVLRRVSNDNTSRYLELEKIIKKKTELIVFYNFTYELNGLRAFFKEHGFTIGEWNGESHTELPTGKRWVYLCQYLAAGEGWNAITTDTIVFFSQNYSYKTMEQAAGRIDRANTPFKDLYYYNFRSTSPIDRAIRQTLQLKGKFNERIFLKGVAEAKRYAGGNRKTS